MAKNDLDDYDDLNFDFDDMDGDSYDGTDSPKNDRKPSSKIIRTLKESAENKARDNKYQRELLKASLPSEYTSVLEDYDTVSKEAGGIWREQQKEWEKHRKEVKKMFKPYTDVLGGIPGLKKIAKWANEEDRVRDQGPTDEQQDELRIQSILSETFGSMQDEQAKREVQFESARQDKDDEKAGLEKADRDAQIKQTIEGNQLLVSINKSTGNLATYNDKINYPYQKRSLELQARQLITQQRMLQTMNSFRELAVKELQDIHKNTALPDYLKITPMEMAQQSAVGKIIGNATAPFDGVGSKIASKVSGKVKAKMGEFWAELGNAASMINTQNEDMAEGIGGDGTAWGGLKSLVGGMLGDSVIEKPARLIQNKIAPKVREMIEEHTGAKLYGSRLKTMGSGFGDLFNDALKSGNTGNGLLDSVIKVFDLQDVAITGNRQVYDTNQLDLEKAAYMDNRFKLSVTEVIPTWLKKIHAEIYAGNNNGSKADDLTWDFKAGKFVKTDDLHDKMMDDFVDKEKVKARVKAVDEWVRIIGQDALSVQAHKWVTGWVTKQINSSSAVNPLKLLADDTPVPTDIREELLYILPVTLRLSEKQKELVSSGLMLDIMAAHNIGSEGYGSVMTKAADKMHEVKSTNPIDFNKLNSLATTPEGREFLKARGITIDNGDGSHSINDGWESDLLNQFEVTRKSNLTGRRSTYKKNRNIKFEDGKDVLGDEILDYDKTHDDWEITDANKNRMQGMGSFYDSSETKDRKRILVKVAQFRDPENRNNPGWGSEYFIDKTGHTHTSADKDFFAKRKQLRPDIERYLKKGFASGGRIESFAKGGDTKLKSGITAGQPDQERTVKTHGGEFVVSHDATKFNVQLLEAINKLGAPLVNADGTINSVYHKVFGFKSAKDFNAGAKLKGLTSKANEVKNEQMELMLKNIIAKLDMSTIKETDAKQLIDPKKSVEKRLASAMKLWSIHQKDLLKSDPTQYGKNLASRGIDILNGKFDKWIDDGTGVNIEIKNKLLAGVKSGFSKTKDAAKGGKEAALAKMKQSKFVAKSKILDHDATKRAIDQFIAEAENPKMFNIPLDLYFKGKGSPFLTKQGFIKKEYIDQATGKIIKNPSDITGNVVDAAGNIIVSVAELAQAQVVTRSGKPYRLIGMEDAQRKYATTAEYVKDRFNLIKNSERFKEGLQKAKDIRDKYVMDKPIDIYLRGVTDKPILYAARFKEGKYIDVNTGNVLWTHHDITGPVKDESGVILTEEQLADGLFDSKQEHVKISKIKQYRNMAFRRGNELYNKYAAKHVNKYAGKVADAMSKMGEKYVGLNYDDNPIDVYVAGEDKPRLRAVDFKAGKIFCKDKPIKSHSGITGPVMMQNEHGFYIALDVEDMGKLLDATGEKIKLTGMMGSKERFFNYLKEAALPSAKLKKLKNFISMSPEKRQELMDAQLKASKIAFDVYLKGKPKDPLLTKLKFEEGAYTSVKSGKPIFVPEQIDGPLVDSTGNQVLTEEHLKIGLVDFDGKKINYGGGLINKIRATMSVGKRLKGILAKKAEGEDGNTGMLKAIGEKLGLKGLGERIGSWKWQRAQKEGKKDDTKKEEVKEKKDSWIGKLVKKFMMPLSVMMGGLASGLGSLKASLLTGVAWLGKALITKNLGGIGSLLGGLAGGGGKWGTIGKAALIAGAAYGGIKAYNYLDGEAGPQDGFNAEDKNASGANMDTTSKVLGMAGAPEQEEKKGLVDTITGNPLATAAMTAAMFMPGTTLKGLGWLGGKAIKGAGWLGGKVTGGAGRLAGRGAMGAASRLPGVLGGAARVAGGVASTVGKLGIGSKVLTGAALRVGGGMALGALRLLTGPVGWGLTAAYFGGKALMKLWNNHKNPWNRFRMAQYGFNHNNKELMEKIAKIEGAATPLVKINAKGECRLVSDEKAMTEVLTICGFKDDKGADIPDQQERLPLFAQWFKNRFVRVYASYLRVLLRLKGKAEMIDLQTLNRKEQEILLKEVHFVSLTDTPYLVTASPFEDPADTEMDIKDVDVIARKLKNKIEQLPIPKNYVEPQGFGSGTPAKDGLDDKTAKKPGKNATEEEKLKHELDKQLDKDAATKLDPKTAVDKANEAVKYQTDSSKIITKMHNEQIRKATEEVNNKTQEQFDKGSQSLMDKFKGWMSGLQNATSNLLSDTNEAVNTPASMSQGGGIFNGMMDSIGTGWSNLTGKSKDIQLGVYKAWRSAGLSDAQAKIMTSEVGRENDYQAKYVYGVHTDPKNKQVNLGFLSWQGSRGRKLYEFLNSKGLIKDGQMVQSQEALNAQAQFAINEINTEKSYAATKNQFLTNPNIGFEEGSDLVGRNYIRWAIDNPQYSADGKKRRKGHYNSLVKNLGSGGGNPAVAAASANAPTAKAAGAPATGANTPNLVMAPNATNKQAGGVMGNAMATLDAKYGGKAQPAGVKPPASTQAPAPAVTKEKYFFGDSIADGFKTHHKGHGWTKVGAPPKDVLFYLKNTVLKTPGEYRNRDIYLSTGMSNNPTDIVTIAEQLRLLKDAGVKVKVFGVSNKYPKGNPVGMNATLASLCKTYGMTFLGGFEPGKDLVHPATYSKLPGSSSVAATPVKQQQKAATAKASDKVTTVVNNANKTANTGAVTATKQPAAQAQTAVTNGPADWDLSKIAKAAINNAKECTIGRCGEYTRRALQAGDLKGKISKILGGTLGAHAYMFVTSLPKIGFNPVFQGKKFGNFVPQIGDVAIFGRGIYGSSNKSSGGWVSGHACVYTGSKWVSDFVQQSVYPSTKYASAGLMMTIFRADGIAPQGGFDAEASMDQTEAGASNKGINSTMNNINTGSASPTGMQSGGVIAATGFTGSDGGGVGSLLSKQLDVQREILSVLKTIAGMPTNYRENNPAVASDPNGIQTTINGVPVDSNGKPINQLPNGMTTPDLSAAAKQVNPEKSPFTGVKHPVSVLKPV